MTAPTPDLTALYRAHGAQILRRAQRILGSESDAEETLHEIFANLVANPELLVGRTAMAAWFYSVTTHACLNRLRDQKNRQRLLAQEGAGAPSSSSPMALESGPMARQFLATLPDDVAACAVYHFVDEMTYDEIAEVLGCSRRHVGNLLKRIEESAGKSENHHA